MSGGPVSNVQLWIHTTLPTIHTTSQSPRQRLWPGFATSPLAVSCWRRDAWTCGASITTQPNSYPDVLESSHIFWRVNFTPSVTHCHSPPKNVTSFNMANCWERNANAIKSRQLNAAPNTLVANPPIPHHTTLPLLTTITTLCIQRLNSFLKLMQYTCIRPQGEMRVTPAFQCRHNCICLCVTAYARVNLASSS